jgi:phospho-N-acetylmuramoyl-pentapeptide-transferase
MAPLHHHFEKGGMPEITVVRRFWLAGALAGAAGLAVAIASIA